MLGYSKNEDMENVFGNEFLDGPFTHLHHVRKVHAINR